MIERKAINKTDLNQFITLENRILIGSASSIE